MMHKTVCQSQMNNQIKKSRLATLIADRGDGCQVRLEDLSKQGRVHTALVGALICFGCMGRWLHFYRENS